MTFNPLSRSAIEQILGIHPWAPLLQLFDEIPSTNALAKELAHAGAPEGTVLIADRQSAGRGRLGRSFLSPGDMGLYLSLILRPNCPPQELMHLTCATAVAVCNGMESAFGFRPEIKWTNDLVYRSKKLGGILTELSVNPKTSLVDFAVVGIGINCRQKPQDFDPSIRDMACSLLTVTGEPGDRNTLAGHVIRALDSMNQTLLTEKETILNRYRADCITLGQEISIVRGDAVFHGKALNLDSEGGLIVRLDNGEMQTVSSGEVSIRGLYGYV